MASKNYGGNQAEPHNKNITSAPGKLRIQHLRAREAHPTVGREVHMSGLSPTEHRNGINIFHIPANSQLVSPPHPHSGVFLLLVSSLALSKLPLNPAFPHEPLLTLQGILRANQHFGTFWVVSIEAIERAGTSLPSLARAQLEQVGPRYSAGQPGMHQLGGKGMWLPVGMNIWLLCFQELLKAGNRDVCY